MNDTYTVEIHLRMESCGKRFPSARTVEAALFDALKETLVEGATYRLEPTRIALSVSPEKA